MTPTTLNFETARHRSVPVNGSFLGALLKAILRAIAGSVSAAQARSALDQAAREAAGVREMAQRYRHSDRGFSADLFAAADRHEEMARSRSGA
jgi:hypothetical protein